MNFSSSANDRPFLHIRTSAIRHTDEHEPEGRDIYITLEKRGFIYLFIYFLRSAKDPTLITYSEDIRVWKSSVAADKLLCFAVLCTVLPPTAYQ